MTNRTRRHWHLATLAAAAAVLAAGCGGGSDETLSVGKVIVFGDSLSDNGAYTPATQIPLGQAAGQPPFFGGKFTTNTFTGHSAASNTSNSNVWVEVVAARVGVPITPHEVGFGPQTVKCPAAATAAALANSCTGYAQGGARVSNLGSNPNGTGLIGSTPVPMSRPMTTQVAFHLTKFGSFAGNDIVFVWGGSNDAIAQFQALAAPTPITPDAALANVRATATELANLVKNEILAKGASRVAVLTLPDISVAPLFAGLTTAQKGLLRQLSGEFNTVLASALSGTAARTIDTRAMVSDLVANPSKYGMTNVTATACDPAKISAFTAGRVTDGSSLFCNASPASAFVSPVPNLNGLKTGASATTWLFADGLHPTTGGHKVLADQVIEQIKAFGWIPANL